MLLILLQKSSFRIRIMALWLGKKIPETTAAASPPGAPAHAFGKLLDFVLVSNPRTRHIKYGG